MIREMTPSDWPVVARIYSEGVEGGNATFETEVPDWESWDSGHLESCRLVYEVEGEIVAWAALSAVSPRDVYRGVAEVSLYVGSVSRGRRVGSELLAGLVDCSEKAGIWTLLAVTFPENEASQQRFRLVGTRERIGSHHGRWRDTVLLERRSPSVGA
ncbi:MAG TPA: GNAT family N-acetyltransferase [Acidimicrobiia bacterium]|nr:GNAT family N-acetyltransferase [Acidimicrobiia bacterium]